MHELHELHELIELQQRKKNTRDPLRGSQVEQVRATQAAAETAIRDAGPSTKRALVERSMMVGDMQPSPACRASRRAVVGSTTDELSAVTPARGKPRWMFCSSARGLQYAHHADAAARPPKSTRPNRCPRLPSSTAGLRDYAEVAARAGSQECVLSRLSLLIAKPQSPKPLNSP